MPTNAADSSLQYLLAILLLCMGGLGTFTMFFVGVVLNSLRGNISRLFTKVDKNCEDIASLKARWELLGFAHHRGEI